MVLVLHVEYRVYEVTKFLVQSIILTHIFLYQFNIYLLTNQGDKCNTFQLYKYVIYL